jgi:hypothetical protein
MLHRAQYGDEKMPPGRTQQLAQQRRCLGVLPLALEERCGGRGHERVQPGGRVARQERGAPWPARRVVARHLVPPGLDGRQRRPQRRRRPRLVALLPQARPEDPTSSSQNTSCTSVGLVRGPRSAAAPFPWVFLLVGTSLMQVCPFPSSNTSCISVSLV